jgi:hypothetical protein
MRRSGTLLTEKQIRDRECSRRCGLVTTWDSVGDVQMCDHGRIFEFVAGSDVWYDGRWIQLKYSNPFRRRRYNRAVAALKD